MGESRPRGRERVFARSLDSENGMTQLKIGKPPSSLFPDAGYSVRIRRIQTVRIS
jgi:hypothetical protein